MAVDITNGISLNIRDGVSVSIPNKLQTIATNALSAADGVDKLQQQLNGINASGLSGLATSMRTSATATNDLAANSSKFANAANNAMQATQAYDAALVNLGLTAGVAAGHIQQLAAATQIYATSARSVVSAANQSVAAQNSFNSSISSGTSARTAAAADIGLLEGRMMSANRAAGSFLVNVLGLGPALQAAFYVTGAIAVVEVLGQVAETVYKIVQAYKDWGNAARRAETQAITSADGVMHNLETRTTDFATVFNKALYGDFSHIDPTKGKIDVDNLADLQKQLALQKEITESQNRANEAGLTGVALRKQQIADAQAELVTQKQIVQAYSNKQVQYSSQLNASHSQEVNDGFFGAKTIQVNDIDKGSAAYKQLQTNVQGATDGLRDANAQVTIIQNNIAALEKKEGLAKIKDDTKAAVAQMKAYNLEFDKLKEGSKVVTPQMALSFWQSKDTANNPKTYQQNELAISGKEGQAQQQIDKQAQAVAQLTEKLKEQTDQIGIYSDAQKIRADVDKDIQSLTKAGVVDAEQYRASIEAQVTDIVKNAEYQKELNTQYQAANAPLRTYTAAQAALITLFNDKAITGDQYNHQLAEANQTYHDAVDPMAQYNRQLQQQIDLSTKYGTQQQMAVQQQLASVAANLQSKGRSQPEINATLSQLGPQLTQLEQQKQLQSDLNAIIEQQTGQMQKLTTQQLALNQARQQGLLGDDAYKAATQQVTNSVIKLQEQMGNASFTTQVKGALTNYTKDYTTAIAGIGKLYDQTFQTIADGAADSLARSIVYADNLNDALKNVARQALEQIISGLIKVGIQALIVHTVGQAAQTASTAAGVAAGTAVAAAWAPAAAAVSLASFGANAAPADLAITGSYALTDALSAFATGVVDLSGPGSGTSDSILARLSAGESVMTANATKMFKPQLQAMNAAANAGVAASATNLGTTSSGSHIEIHDHSTGSKQYSVQETQEGKLRVMIRDEVRKTAPGIVADHIRNPNSPVSKSLSQSTDVRRKNR